MEKDGATERVSERVRGRKRERSKECKERKECRKADGRERNVGSKREEKIMSERRYI